MLLGGTEAEGVDPEYFHPLSVTVDPFLPIADIWQVTVEFRPMVHWSGAVVAGWGGGDSYFGESPSWEMGGQLRWYPWNPTPLEWLFLAEFIGGRTRLEDYGSLDESTNLSAALAAGFKYAAYTGFTIEGQLGALASRSDYRFDETELGWTPYLNFGVGWSF